MLSAPNIRVLVRGIKSRLAPLLEGRTAGPEDFTIVRISHAIAKESLARKIHSGALERIHGLNYSDLAYDCIAELFARDESGKYVALASYFAAFNFAQFSDEEVLFHLQRLVLTKVKHGVYRLYQQTDPQLGRILRNIKIAAQSRGLFYEVDRLGEACLVPSTGDALEEMPLIQPEELAQWLVRSGSGNEFVPELLEKVSDVIRAQEERCRIVPLVTMGLSIRMFYEQKRSPHAEEGSYTIDDSTFDSGRVIEAACTKVKLKAKAKYVDRGKIAQEVLDLYFKAIEEGLMHRFVEHDGSDFVLSDALLKLMPGLTFEEYRKKHKNKIEYLGRLAKKQVVLKLQGN